MGHGEIDTADPLTLSPYTLRPKETSTIAVPEGCAVATLASVGDPVIMDKAGVQLILAGWNVPENAHLFANIVKAGEEGEAGEAKKFVRAMGLQLSEAKSLILPSYVYPFLAWIDLNESDHTKDVYTCMSSGIKSCPSGPHELFIDLPRGLLLDTTIREVFKNSVFPTPEELLADKKLRALRTRPSTEVTDYERFIDVEAYLFHKYRCSQRMMFRKLKGAHYNIICRVVPDDESRAVRHPPARRLSSAGLEGLTHATATSAVLASAAPTVAGRREDETQLIVKKGERMRQAKIYAEKADMAAELEAEKVESVRTCCGVKGCFSCFASWCPRWCSSWRSTKKAQRKQRRRPKSRTRKNRK
jgi:hypothetical protein